MATGTTTVDFGVFPGKSQASTVITGQTGILTSSLVEAWIFPKATIDHSEDEQMLENIKITVPFSTIIAGTGFTIQAYSLGKNLIGLFTVNWVWI